MKFRSINDKYEIAPPVSFGKINNRALPEDEMFYLTVTGINLTEQELLEKEAALDAAKFEPEKRIDEQKKRTYAKVKEHVVSIHNYELPTGPVTDLDELVKHGGPELVRWLFGVLTSLESLSRAERHNFLAPSGSLSTSPTINSETNGSAGTATSASDSSATAATASA